jgi:hypothetical protein
MTREAPEWQRLYERRESYRIGIVPEPGQFLTAGVDVQKDRIEVEIVAWGRNKESWSVDYPVIEGDTARPDVWAKLDAVLGRDWPHSSGHTLPIRRCASTPAMPRRTSTPGCGSTRRRAGARRAPRRGSREPPCRGGLLQSEAKIPCRLTLLRKSAICNSQPTTNQSLTRDWLWVLRLPAILALGLGPFSSTD